MVGFLRLYALHLCLVGITITPAAAAPAEADASLIVSLTVNNFHREVESSDGFVFVEFFAPWCGHCKKLLPELEEAAKQLRGTPGMKIAKMDADRAENKPIGKKFGVKGFPSLKIFKDGKVFADYGRGGRTARHIVSYLKRLQTPAVIEIAGDEEVSAFTSRGNGDNPVYVLLGGGPEVTQTFAAVAEKARGHTWFYATASPSAAVVAALGAQRLPAVVAIHESTGAEVHYPGAVDADDASDAAMITFVDNTRLPVVVRLEQAMFPAVAHSPRPAVLLLVSGGALGTSSAAAGAPAPTPMTGEEREVARSFLDVAKLHRDAVQFVTVDMFLLGPWVKHEMGLVPGKGGVRLPAVVVFHKKNEEMWFDPRWRERGESVSEALESLLRDAVHEKTLAPTYLRTTPLMRKLEREIGKHPHAAVAVAFVPVALVLGCLMFSSFGGGGGGGGGSGGEKASEDSSKVVKSGAPKVRQRR